MTPDDAWTEFNYSRDKLKGSWFISVYPPKARYKGRSKTAIRRQRNRDISRHQRRIGVKYSRKPWTGPRTGSAGVLYHSTTFDNPITIGAGESCNVRFTINFDDVKTIKTITETERGEIIQTQQATIHSDVCVRDGPTP